MRITTGPFTGCSKLVDKPLPGRSYVDQIDAAFTTALSEKKELQKKLDKYRLSMQKSILDSIVSDSSNSKMNGIMDIDQFFSDEPDNMIFVIKISLPRKNFNANEVVEYLENALPDKNSCALLEAGKAHGIFMINYPGIEDNKDEVIRLLLSDYCRETGCTAAVSNGASSPLEIPYLYENALLADKYRQDAAVVSYTEIAPLIPSPSNLAYPYKNLDALALCLKTPDFKQAHELKKELLSQIDSASENGTLFPDFFIRCVLIDILTIIINAMNRMNIKFKNYSDLYFETLYLCRSCPYQEKGGEISRNVDELLATFEAEYANSAVHASQIMEILQECYTSPDFSISVLADKFEVSIAYMSYLFKKKFDKNFSDYLWELRLAKAKDMLLNTSMPIDQISVCVGYLNVSSFRRKFKQEIGITPSQFRNGKG
ncbi:MAG: helix-turn-helix domain-containing protein [Eisenbergiella sp.]